MLQRGGATNAGLKLLDQTIESTRAQKLIRVCVDRGREPLAMLQCLSERRPDDEYLARIVAAFSADQLIESTADQLAPARATEQKSAAGVSLLLSNREIDVLILMEQRLTNQRIATRLHISTETVSRSQTARLRLRQRWLRGVLVLAKRCVRWTFSNLACEKPSQPLHSR